MGLVSVVVLAALVLAGTAATTLRDMTGIDATLADPTPVIRVLGHGAVLTGLLIGVVFSMLNPDTSRLETLLRLVGSTRRQRLAMLLVPIASVTGVLALLFCAPLVVFAVGLTVGVGTQAPLAATIVLLAGLSSVTGLAGHQALARLLRRRLRLTVIHSSAGAALLAIAVAMTACRPAFAPGPPPDGLPALVPGEAAGLVFGALSGRSGVASAVLPIVVLFAAAAGVVLLCGRESPPPRTGRLWASRHIAAPRGPFAATVWFEVLTLGRSPATVVAVIGALAASVAAAVARNSSVADLVLLVGPAAAAATAMRATGVNLASSWVIWTLRGKDARWSLSKVVGAAVIAIALLIACSPVLVVAGGGAAVLAVTIQVFVPTFAGSLAAGSLAPVSDEAPLSTAVGGALTLIITGGLSVAIGRGLSVVGVGNATVSLALVVVAALLLVLAAHRRLRPEAVVSHT